MMTAVQSIRQCNASTYERRHGSGVVRMGTNTLQARMSVVEHGIASLHAKQNELSATLQVRGAVKGMHRALLVSV